MKGHDQDQNGVQTSPPSQCQGIHIWPLLFQNQFFRLQSWNGWVCGCFFCSSAELKLFWFSLPPWGARISQVWVVRKTHFLIGGII